MTRIGTININVAIFLAGVFAITPSFEAFTKQSVNSLAAPVVQHMFWNGYPEDIFVLEGHHCLIVLPNSFTPDRPWIWRPEFFGAYDQADQALLSNGYSIAYMDMNNIFGSPPAMELMDKYYDYPITHYTLAAKTTLFEIQKPIVDFVLKNN